MNSLYFAIGCILIVLLVFWGSLDTEPKRLAALFGQSPQKPPKAPKKKVRW
jgi:hypothetical protein